MLVSQPTGDPVDSDHYAESPLLATDGLIRAGLSYPVRTLTVFTHLACSGPKTNTAPRCGLSSTYHCKPLTFIGCQIRKQYDLQPTRGYHSIMLIHDSLDTEAFQSAPLHYNLDLTCPRTLASPLSPVVDTFIGSSTPFWCQHWLQHKS